MEDPFLNYLALGLPFFVVIVLVYGIIAIHDIPARIVMRVIIRTRTRSARRLDQPVHAPRAVAVPLDLGGDVSSQSAWDSLVIGAPSLDRAGART